MHRYEGIDYLLASNPSVVTVEKKSSCPSMPSARYHLQLEREGYGYQGAIGYRRRRVHEDVHRACKVSNYAVHINVELELRLLGADVLGNALDRRVVDAHDHACPLAEFRGREAFRAGRSGRDEVVCGWKTD